MRNHVNQQSKTSKDVNNQDKRKGRKNCRIHTLEFVFQAGFEEKAQIPSLNLEVTMYINRDPCTHFYSFKKLAVQGNGLELQGRGFYPPHFLLYGMFFSYFVMMFVAMCN